MPKRGIAMHKIKRTMRLSHEADRSQKEIARACGPNSQLGRPTSTSASVEWTGR